MRRVRPGREGRRRRRGGGQEERSRAVSWGQVSTLRIPSLVLASLVKMEGGEGEGCIYCVKMRERIISGIKTAAFLAMLAVSLDIVNYNNIGERGDRPS